MVLSKKKSSKERAIHTIQCVNCNKKIKSKYPNKKYCGKKCALAYHYKKNKTEKQSSIRKLNIILAKNRNILESLFPNDKETVKVSRNLLIQHGFDFNYLTQFRPAKKGGNYIYCYEYGYLELKNNIILIVRKD